MRVKNGVYAWRFKARFRRHAFGWRSQPAITRVKEAVAEIRQAARQHPTLGGEGAVVFLERLSPALEHVDSSSGAIGTAVNHAIAALVPIIADARVDMTTRRLWLERLFEAHEADQIPYIEHLADFWGELCGSRDVASTWGDRLISITRMALSPDKNLRGYFHGTAACLSALFAAERYDEVVNLVTAEVIWPYKRWAVRALAAQSQAPDAIRYAEGCRGPWAPDQDIDAVCEEILLGCGRVEEAYSTYALTANRAGTYLAWFRAVAKKYPHRTPAEVLTDLIRQTPGDEGKWFAAAKDAGLLDEAIALATRTPCDPRTLARAARDFAERDPVFAIEAGMASLHWLVEGYGYEITSADVWAAYASTMAAAGHAGRHDETRVRIRQLVELDRSPGRFITRVLGHELGRGSL
jgi:hypothetical protein